MLPLFTSRISKIKAVLDECSIAIHHRWVCWTALSITIVLLLLLVGVICVYHGIGIVQQLPETVELTALQHVVAAGTASIHLLVHLPSTQHAFCSVGAPWDGFVADANTLIQANQEFADTDMIVAWSPISGTEVMWVGEDREVHLTPIAQYPMWAAAQTQYRTASDTALPLVGKIAGDAHGLPFFWVQQTVACSGKDTGLVVIQLQLHQALHRLLDLTPAFDWFITDSGAYSHRTNFIPYGSTSPTSSAIFDTLKNESKTASHGLLSVEGRYFLWYVIPFGDEITFVVAEHSMWSLLWTAKFTMLGLVLAVPAIVLVTVTACRARHLGRRNYELEEALAMAEDGAKTFLAMFSHEMRTPLNHIIGVVPLLMRAPLPESELKLLETISTGSKALLDKINDVLDFAGMCAQPVKLAPETLHIRRCVDDVVSIYASPARDKGIYMVVNVEVDVPTFVIADSCRLQQVLSKLLDNAVKFTEHGQIHLDVSVNDEAFGGGLHFRVFDTGVGMDADQVATALQPFRQLDMSSTRHFGGTGLGLYICQRLVKRWHGQLHIRALGRHRGTEISFTYPSKRWGPAMRMPPSNTPRRVVLVVSGCLHTGHSMRNMLSWMELDVTVLTEYSAAMEWLRKQTAPVSCIFLAATTDTMTELRVGGQKMTSTTISNLLLSQQANKPSVVLVAPVCPMDIAELGGQVVHLKAPPQHVDVWDIVSRQQDSEAPEQGSGLGMSEFCHASVVEDNVCDRKASGDTMPIECSQVAGQGEGAHVPLSEPVDGTDTTTETDSNLSKAARLRLRRKHFTKMALAKGTGPHTAMGRISTCSNMLPTEQCLSPGPVHSNPFDSVLQHHQSFVRPSTVQAVSATYSHLQRTASPGRNYTYSTMMTTSCGVVRIEDVFDANRGVVVPKFASSAVPIIAPLSPSVRVDSGALSGSSPEVYRRTSGISNSLAGSDLGSWDSASSLDGNDAGRDAGASFRELDHRLQISEDAALGAQTQASSSGHAVQQLPGASVRQIKAIKNVSRTLSCIVLPPAAATSVPSVDPSFAHLHRIHEAPIQHHKRGVPGSITSSQGPMSPPHQGVASLSSSPTSISRQLAKTKAMAREIEMTQVMPKSSPRAAGVGDGGLHNAVELQHTTTPIAATLPQTMPVEALKMLVVDDVEVNRRLLSLMLTKLGCQVQTANDGVEACNACQATRFDIIFMDCTMPRMDGWTATQTIRTFPGYATIPILAVTALASQEDMQRCYDSGMDGVLCKPITPAMIQQAVAKWAPKLSAGEPRSNTMDVAQLLKGAVSIISQPDPPPVDYHSLPRRNMTTIWTANICALFMVLIILACLGVMLWNTMVYEMKKEMISKVRWIADVQCSTYQHMRDDRLRSMQSALALLDDTHLRLPSNLTVGPAEGWLVRLGNSADGYDSNSMQDSVLQASRHINATGQVLVLSSSVEDLRIAALLPRAILMQDELLVGLNTPNANSSGNIEWITPPSAVSSELSLWAMHQALLEPEGVAMDAMEVVAFTQVPILNGTVILTSPTTALHTAFLQQLLPPIALTIAAFLVPMAILTFTNRRLLLFIVAGLRAQCDWHATLLRESTACLQQPLIALRDLLNIRLMDERLEASLQAGLTEMLSAAHEYILIIDIIQSLYRKDVQEEWDGSDASSCEKIAHRCLNEFSRELRKKGIEPLLTVSDTFPQLVLLPQQVFHQILSLAMSMVLHHMQMTTTTLEVQLHFLEPNIMLTVGDVSWTQTISKEKSNAQLTVPLRARLQLLRLLLTHCKGKLLLHPQERSPAFLLTCIIPAAMPFSLSVSSPTLSPKTPLLLLSQDDRIGAECVAEGLTVQVASDLEEMRHMLASNSYMATVVDFEHPSLQAVDLADLHHELQDHSVIAVTRMEDCSRVRRAGFDFTLPQSFTSAELSFAFAKVAKSQTAFGASASLLHS